MVSNSERIPEAVFECLGSVGVGGIELLSSTPEVNQSKAALAGSVVATEALVVECGPVKLVLDFEAAEALFPS